MRCFNGYDMADFDAYDSGYSHRLSRKWESKQVMREIWRDRARAKHIEQNVKCGIWFTGESIVDMTDEHLKNALALCKRKHYTSYVKLLESEIERRKVVS